ncbi:hypothetical protein [Paenibacillus polymyxa]
MLLRKVDVFLHFLSRFLEGTDQSHVLQEQVKQISADLLRLSTKSSWIQEELAKLEQCRNKRAACYVML